MTNLTTPNLGLPYPDSSENVDVPSDLGALANAIDTLNFVPVGSMLMWPAAVAPGGWLLCQGQTVPAASYPGLAAVLGATGGNVTLPDYRDLFPIGAGPGHALGATGGEATHLLTAAESGVNGNGRAPGSTNTDPGHQHNIHYAAGAGAPNWTLLYRTETDPRQFDGYQLTELAGAHSHSFNAALTARNADTPHNNVPPFRAINFIIKAG